MTKTLAPSDFESYGPKTLDIGQDVAQLTQDLLDIFSVSGEEKCLADAVEQQLTALSHLSVVRNGDSIIARTNWGKSQRVVLAGHLDTVPLPQVEGSLGTVPSRWIEEDGEQILYGRGATDMKGGVAVQLALAATLTDAAYDITYVFYDHEEVASELSGLARLMREHRDLLTDTDFAVLLEPTDGTIEGGCNGTMRFWVHCAGKAAHSGRAWVGENAIHKMGDVLTRLATYKPQTYEVEGLAYREGLNAVQIRGGVAGNVIPDAASVHINYRFAPNKTLDEAIAHVEEVFEGYELDFVDQSSAARPGLDAELSRSLIESVGQEPKPKYGWTDVARFSEIGIPAVNFGPGDALLAHTDNEHVSASAIDKCYRALKQWLIA
ncbi:succinyl-diaminopimelate desuccinylase [Rothia sp. ZJ932]|uniref:succinyl-diaminopimelate desuccinylase n=1 Tax=Rothia sp. ZJ932 TaxID=2810516 RepID=UPI0019670950|nr:succinyl-diaminopimelate desuccinylase [Rothia sp. ZJ932]QRZ62194.1 succinyl-diaminopimelate desuccinylase [Rothia sp. ZJ932]